LYQDLYHWVFPLIFWILVFFNKSRIIGFGALLDGFYFIELQDDVAYNSMHVTTGLK